MAEIPLSNIQTIFTVTYSIIYGIMLNSCGGLHLFHFGWLFQKNFDQKKKQDKIGFRVIISIIFINILPFIFFSIFYLWLGKFESEVASLTFEDPLLNITAIISIFLLSQIVFSFYRSLHYFIVRGYLFDKKFENGYNRTRGLDDQSYKYKNEIRNIENIGLKAFFKRRENMGPSETGHLFAILIYLIPPISGILTLIQISQLCLYVDYFFLGTICVCILHWIGESFNKNESEIIFKFLIIAKYLTIFWLTLRPLWTL